MNAFTIAGLAVITAMLSLTVRQYRSDLSVLISIAGGAVMLLMILAYASGIVELVQSRISEWGIESDTIGMIIKAIGIAYIAQIASQLCKDMGEGALAIKTELAGKLMLLVLAAPIVLELIGKLTELIKGTL